MRVLLLLLLVYILPSETTGMSCHFSDHQPSQNSMQSFSVTTEAIGGYDLDLQ